MGKKKAAKKATGKRASVTLARESDDLLERVEYVPIASLKLDPNNARKHDKRNIASIQASIARFGQRRPAVVQRAGMIVRAGNGMVEALKNLGRERVAVVIVDDTELEAAAYAIADNRTAELASWDENLLGSILGGLREDDEFDHLVAGFTDEEIDDLLGLSSSDGGGEVVEDEIPEEVPERAALGDVWALGNHRVYCGDAFEDRTWAPLVGLERPLDLVATDPPYAIYGSSTGIARDITDDKMVRPFFKNVAELCKRRTVETAHVYVFCDWRSYAVLRESLITAGLAPKNCIVWDKGDGGLGSSYANCHEFIAFFANLPMAKSMKKGRDTEQRKVLKPNIIRVNRATGDERQHNAAKPLELMRQLIENSSDQGDRVGDFFLGSGSTLIACETAGRVCVGTEEKPRNVDVVLERWQRLTGGTAQKL